MERTEADVARDCDEYMARKGAYAIKLSQDKETRKPVDNEACFVYNRICQTSHTRGCFVFSQRVSNCIPRMFVFGKQPRMEPRGRKSRRLVWQPLAARFCAGLFASSPSPTGRYHASHENLSSMWKRVLLQAESCAKEDLLFKGLYGTGLS